MRDDTQRAGSFACAIIISVKSAPGGFGREQSRPPSKKFSKTHFPPRWTALV